MKSTTNLIACLACAAGAAIASGMGKGFARGGAAEIWYTIMSICLLGMALIYAAWWVVELAEELAQAYRKKHRQPYGKITRSHARNEEPEYRQEDAV